MLCGLNTCQMHLMYVGVGSVALGCMCVYAVTDRVVSMEEGVAEYTIPTCSP